MHTDENELDTTIHLAEVSVQGLKGNAFIFLPPLKKEIQSVFALLTHGYTSHKGSILNWASRLGDLGVPTLLFDLPGHYLGGFNQVPSFEMFKNHGHELFVDAFEKLKAHFVDQFPLDSHKVERENMVLLFGGHSLGALLALKAMTLPEFQGFDKRGVAVGLGMSPASGDKSHLFESEFYKKTLNLRQQLVAPELHPEKVFPWIKQEKETLFLKNQKVCLITGQDDVVSPPKKVQELADRLVQLKNEVSVMTPKRLSHHQPELAAAHISQYLKGQGVLKG